MKEEYKLKSLIKRCPDKCAVVTGGGSGLGFSITQELLKDDWQVIVFDLKVIDLPKHDNLVVYEQDITDIDAFQDQFLEVLNNYPVEILFNNAGVGEGVSFENYSMENWNWIIDINLKSIIHCSKMIIPFFKKKERGLIVNISSAAGFANLPKMSPYNVTKAGVISLSETLDYELKDTGIVIKCVTPTFFRSNILQRSRGDDETLQSASRIISNSSWDSDQAACVILKKITKRPLQIRFPFTASTLFHFKRLFPNLFRYIIKKKL